MIDAATVARLTDAEWDDVLATLPENPEEALGWELSLVRRTVERLLTTRVEQARAELLAKLEALADEWDHIGHGNTMESGFALGYNTAMLSQAETLRAYLARIREGF